MSTPEDQTTVNPGVVQAPPSEGALEDILARQASEQTDDWAVEANVPQSSATVTHPRKRKRESEAREPPMTTLVPSRRNFDQVIFGQWQMRTWYASPYPLSEGDEPPPVARRSPPPPPPASPSSKKVHATSQAPTSTLSGKKPLPTLWVCDRCFKYMKDGVTWEVHMKKCDVVHPPGRKVYQRGAHTIWEVDGAEQKLYCQNLALFGKLFIDIKTIFFDCDNFRFYIATDAESKRDHALGFFSKEKVSYDDYNLACIITFPPYQKRGYGMLLIEFSYELSRRQGKLGTPERPLSDLGLRSYLAYWTAVLVRFFRKILGTEPGNGHQRKLSLSKKKKYKGFDGEVADDGPSASVVEQPAFGSIRTTHTEASPNGEGTISHLTIRCTLMDIARATGLRHEDVAFTLRECGMLVEIEGGGNLIGISGEMVEKVAMERGVKHICILDPAHVLL